MDMINELGLPDDSSLLDRDHIDYPIHRRKITKIISINIIIFIILLILSTGFIYSFIKKQPSIQQSTEMTTISSQQINNLSLIDDSRIKVGVKFGDITGFHFDDSLIARFTLSHYVRGVTFLADWYPLHWFQCFYSSPDDLEDIIEGDIHGRKEINDTFQRFFLDKDEKISKIEVKVDSVQLIENDILTIRTRLIMGIRFFTTKGRKSRSIDDIKGQRYIEQFDGYTLGYVTGNSGRYINQLQFYWYKTL